MKSLNNNYIHSLRFEPTDLSILREIGRYRGKQELYAAQAPQMLEALRRSAVIESNESSNRIEQVVAPRERIKGLVEYRIQPGSRSEQEIAGYRDVLSLIHGSAEQIPFSVNVILQFHRTLYTYHPSGGGMWKMTDNEIVERNPDGTVARVRFKPVTTVATPQAMEDLAVSYAHLSDDTDSEPLVIVPLAILDFLCIHPFRDGNGRIGRLLTLLLLYHFDYRVGRYISLERVIEGSKETYYESLEASSIRWHEGHHNVLPWLRYFWGVLLSAYHEFDERVGGLETGSKTEMIRHAVQRRTTPFSISDLEEELSTVSRDMIRLVLRQMRDEEIIHVIGKGRAARWQKM